MVAGLLKENQMKRFFLGVWISLFCLFSFYSNAESLRKLKIKPNEIAKSKLQKLYDSNIQKKINLPSVLKGNKLETKIIFKLTDKEKITPDTVNTIRIFAKKDNIINYKLIGKSKNDGHLTVTKEVLEQAKNVFLTKDQWLAITFDAKNYKQYNLIIKAKLPLVLAEVDIAYNQTDFNIDGFNDIFIADPILGSVSGDDLPIGQEPGQIHLMNGGFASNGIDFNTSFDETIYSTNTQEFFGMDMLMADVLPSYEGSELLVLAPNLFENVGANYSGNIHIYSRVSGAWQVVQTLSGISPFQMACGDVTNDGFLDLITVDVVPETGTTDVKILLKVYPGSSDGLSVDNVIVSDPIIFTSNGSSDGIELLLFAIFGFDMLDLIDLNNDGVLDIVFLFLNPSDNNAFYTLGNSNLSSQDLNANLLDMSLFSNTFLISAANAGDLNSDGYDDLALGAPDFKSENNNQGRVFLLMGNQTDFDQVTKQILSPVSSALGFGYSVKKAGDMNGDGFSDLLIFSMEPFSTLGTQGFFPIAKLYVLLGGSDLDHPDLVEILLPGLNLGFMLNAHAIGDVNGDGYDDLIVTQFPFLTGFFTSSCMIVFGGEKENLETGLTIRVIASPNDDGVLFGSKAI